MAHSMASVQYVWRRLVSSRQVDPWMERLLWIGRDRIVVRELAGRKRSCLEVYCRDANEARRCEKEFGGEVRKLRRAQWMKSQQRRFVLPLPPVACIVSPDAPVEKRFADLPRVELPAALAFGTGEHPTTSMCLRRLISAGRGDGKRLLDAGTGSGILALVAALAGYEVTAIDYDPDSVVECHRNAERNPHVPPVDWQVGDITSLDTRRRYHRILANLYLNVLDQALPRFRKSLLPEGDLVLSGIMADQEKEALRMLSATGFQLDRRYRKGKWLCLTARQVFRSLLN